MTQTPNGQDTARRWRDIALLAGLFALVVAGLAGLAAATGWQETAEALRQLGGGQIAVLLVLSLVNYLFRGLRWHYFARRLGLPTGIGQDLRHFIGGFAMSVTPGRVGELVRMRWLRRETGWSFERTAPLVLVDRASDLSAMALLMSGGLLLSHGGIRGGVPVAVAALVLAFVATRPAFLHRLAGLGYRLTGRLGRIFVRLRRAARSLKAFADGPTMATATLIGLIGWGAEGVGFFLLLDWMGADISAGTAIAIFTFATLAGGLTGAPGGVGGAEAAMVLLLGLEGVPLGVALPATLIIRVTTLWFAIGLGLAVFPLAERQSRRSRHELEHA